MCLNERQGERIRIFENKRVRGIFGHKREGVREGWRMLLNGEFCKFSDNLVNLTKQTHVN